MSSQSQQQIAHQEILAVLLQTPISNSARDLEITNDERQRLRQSGGPAEGADGVDQVGDMVSPIHEKH